MFPARLFVSLLMVGCAAAQATAFPPLSRLDQYGDPLSAGAAARLGTVRLRAGFADLHFSADGKTLFGCDRWFAYMWSAHDGHLASVRPICGSDIGWYAASEDGRTLWSVSSNSIQLRDSESLGEIEIPRLPHLDPIRRIVLSNDRRWAIVKEIKSPKKPRPCRLSLINLADASARLLSDDEIDDSGFVFASDGRRVAVSGGPAVRVWDVESGKKLWEVPRPETGECRFTPDCRYLVVEPGRGQRDWQVFDAESGEPAATRRVPEVRGRFAGPIGPDDRVLVTTADEFIVWDLRTGRIQQRWPLAGVGGRGAFSPDGTSVVTADTVLRRRELSTGKNLFADIDSLGHAGPVRNVFFAPDGRRLISVGGDRAIRVWDLAAAKSVRTMTFSSPTYTWAMVPDGSALVGIDGLTMHRFSLVRSEREATAEMLEARKLHIVSVRDARVTPDGSLVVAAWAYPGDGRGSRYSFSTWDVGSGKLVRSGADPECSYSTETVRLSPDGRFAATPEATFDTQSGAKLPFPSSPFGTGGTPVFSPDSRLLAAASRDTRVWELATGRVIVDLPIASLERATFSRDGRRLAYAVADRIAVWDVGLRKLVADWPTNPVAEGHDPLGVQTMAFSPDGRLLATGQADGTILLWPVPAPVPDGRWSESEANSAWEALADDVPANAYPALWQLADYPADAVRFLRAKVALAPAATPDEIAKQIARLDSPRFAEREAASRRLLEFGRVAEGPLRDALKQKPSPEQVARIEALLAALEPNPRPGGGDLRAVRAVAVLEAVGTSEARALLAEWAERGSPPRLAVEAGRAAERLRYRP